MVNMSSTDEKGEVKQLEGRVALCVRFLFLDVSSGRMPWTNIEAANIFFS